jgi:hypothetical protein
MVDRPFSALSLKPLTLLEELVLVIVGFFSSLPKGERMDES